MGSGIPDCLATGFGKRETGSIKADSKAFPGTSDFSLVRDSCIFRCPCFVYFQTPLLDFFQLKHIQIS